jgi:uncharacterized protein
VKPHFFGTTTEPLYGVYDEPRTTVQEPLAVLVCYPIAGEYMRAHRAFRQLTNLLSRSGAHVMRFDYFATGDSAGGSADMSVARWIEDIGTAVQELRELCQAETVTLVGLRFGATLALLAGDREEAVEHVVLWDPIVDGAAYVKDLEGKHVAEQRGRGGSLDTSGTIGVNGFPVPAPLRAEIRDIDLCAWKPASPLAVDLVVSSERDEWRRLGEHLASLPGDNAYEVAPSAGDWDEADEFGSALIPQQIIQSVVARIMERNG